MMDRRRLGILLRNCATHIEQDEFDPKLVRETLAQLDAYFRFHAKRPSPFFAAAATSESSTATTAASETIHNVSSSFDESSYNARPVSASAAFSTNDDEDEYDRLARDFNPKPYISSSSTSSSAATAPPMNMKQPRAPTPTAPPMTHASSSSSLAENTPIAPSLSSSSNPMKPSSSSSSSATKLSSSSSSQKEKKCFQRPVNPNSTLICNGYVDLLLPREKTSSINSNPSSSVQGMDPLPTYIRYPQMLASLVEGRPNTLEETTLWIQRRTVIDPMTNQAKLDVVQSVPLRWLVHVRPLLSSEVGVGEYGFAIQVYQPHLKSTPTTTNNNTAVNHNNINTKEDMTSECIQEWLIKVDDENGCADWIATLFSARNAAKEKARNVLLQKKTGVSTTSNIEQQQQPSISGEGKATPARKNHPPPPPPTRQDSSSYTSTNNVSSGNKKISEETAPSKNKVYTGTADTHVDMVQKMTIKELRAIAHGAGYDTRGMERADLEQIALMNAPASTFHKPPSVSSSSSNGSSSSSAAATAAASIPSMDSTIPTTATNSSNNHLPSTADSNYSASGFVNVEATKYSTSEPKVSVNPDHDETRRRAAQQHHFRKNFDPLNDEYDPFSAPPVAPPTTQPNIPQGNASYHHSSSSFHSSTTPVPNQKFPPSSNSSAGTHSSTTTTTNERSFHSHPGREEKKSENPMNHNVNAKYAQAMSDSASTATKTASSEEQQALVINGLKRQILLQWALIPPSYNTLRPIDELLSTVHSVFPPCLGLPPHGHFNTWVPISKGDLIDTNNNSAIMKASLDDEKLKKAVRKLRFFLHPDRLPRELNPEQSFVCKMLWDVTNDSWEEYQKHQENLDWVK